MNSSLSLTVLNPTVCRTGVPSAGRVGWEGDRSPFPPLPATAGLAANPLPCGLRCSPGVLAMEATISRNNYLIMPRPPKRAQSPCTGCLNGWECAASVLVDLGRMRQFLCKWEFKKAGMADLTWG